MMLTSNKNAQRNLNYKNNSQFSQNDGQSSLNNSPNVGNNNVENSPKYGQAGAQSGQASSTQSTESAIRSSERGSGRSSVSVTPTVQMYTSIISAFGKSGDWERAFALFQNMQVPQGGILPLKPDKVGVSV